jgi:cytochrome c556
METHSMLHSLRLGLGLGCLWLVAAAAGTHAADEAELKKLCADIPKLAEAIKKKDNAQVKKLVEEMKKSNLDAIMATCGLRNLGGIGVGDKPGAIKPDGIEKKVEALGKKAILPTQLKDEAAAIAKMAYEIAAVNELTIAHTPDKDMGQAKKKTWVDSCKDLQTAALELAAAAEAKSPDPKVIQKAAARVDTNCQKCHTEWR